jgi:PAT family beta-lactamase induction signal transducer AmpG
MQFLSTLIRSYTNRHVLAIGCIAYANCLPLLLTSSTLGIWLKSYGLSFVSIGFFGLLHLPYTFKFLWAPLLDQVPLPFLKRYLGQRRSWLCLLQLTAIAGLWGMAFFDPISDLKKFVACAFIVTFSSASQHVLLLTYQMEILRSQEWGVGEGMGVLGYRLGMLTSGAGALYLATFLSWQEIYFLISFLMFIGLITVLLMQEPDPFLKDHTHSFESWRQWASYAFIGPFKDFIRQDAWKAILVFMLVYRLPENLSHMMLPLFLLDLGFSYVDIGNATKIFGLSALVIGGIIGGYWIRIYGYRKVLWWGGSAHGLSYLLFFIQNFLVANLSFLYFTTGIEHFLGGVTLTAFFAYQLTCCRITFAATQLALLTSLASLSHTLCSPLSGFLVKMCGWGPYFLIVSFSSLIGLAWIRRIPFPRPS